jgi:hypothetical protein
VQDSIYQELKEEYPVLAELESRENALTELANNMLSSYRKPGTYPENASILYGCIARLREDPYAVMPLGA